MKTAQADIKHRLVILKNRFAILTNRVMMSYTILLIKAGNFSNGIYFKIIRVQGKDEAFEAEKTLKEDGAYDRFSELDTV